MTPYWKSTVVIYSAFPPGDIELTDLAREADAGDAICTDMQVEQVNPDKLPEAAASFFMEDGLHDIGEGDSDAAGVVAAYLSRPGPAEPDLSHWSVADTAAYLARLADAGCTGAVTPLQDGSVVIQHDGESCPIHETKP